MNNQILLSAGDEETSPYQPVWLGVTLQLLLVTGISAVALLVDETFNLQLDGSLERVLRVGLALLPPICWLAVSAFPESRVRRSRQNLIGIAILGGLAAAAVGWPLVRDFFRVEQWLPLESTFGRIVGFAFTAGTVDVALKLFILRFAIHPKNLRIRSDVIAYAFAVAVGYSFYLNLALIWGLQPSFGIAAIYVLANYAIQFASSMWIALGFIEYQFGNALPIVLPLNLFAAAVSTGIITPLFSTVMSGPLGTAGNSDRPLFGLAFLTAALMASAGISYFLYFAAAGRERAAYWVSEAGDGLENEGPAPVQNSRRQRWSIAWSGVFILLCLALGVNLRDTSINQANVYINVEAGITAHYPQRWLLDEGGDYVFRVRDMAYRGFNTLIELGTLPVSPDTVERNLLDRLTLKRSQTLIDYTILGYENYRLPDESQAVAMSYSFVSRDASPFLEGVSSIVLGLDILTIARGQALIVSFRADASIYQQELATLDWFIQNLDF